MKFNVFSQKKISYQHPPETQKTKLGLKISNEEAKTALSYLFDHASLIYIIYTTN
jgi:hypothetical protein